MTIGRCYTGKALDLTFNLVELLLSIELCTQGQLAACFEYFLLLNALIYFL